MLAPGRPVAEDDEWRLVTATGTYAADDTVIVRYRTRDGAAGIDVVVPLVTADGTALLVDRGWLRTDNRGSDRRRRPAAPAGEVTVDGLGAARRHRRQHRGRRPVDAGDLQRARSARRSDREVYGGFVDLRSEDPPPATAPGAGRAARPRTRARTSSTACSGGSSACWRSFGFVYLAYDEWRKRAGSAAQRRDAKDAGPELADGT